VKEPAKGGEEKKKRGKAWWQMLLEGSSLLQLYWANVKSAVKMQRGAEKGWHRSRTAPAPPASVQRELGMFTSHHRALGRYCWAAGSGTGLWGVPDAHSATVRILQTAKFIPSRNPQRRSSQLFPGEKPFSSKMEFHRMQNMEAQFRTWSSRED